MGKVDIREHSKIYSVSDYSKRGSTITQFHNSDCQWRGSSNSCASMLGFPFPFNFVKVDVWYSVL